MPTYKHVWKFTEANGGTFSEVWYREAPSITSELQLTTALLNARLALLHPQNRFTSDVISNTNNSRDATISTKNVFGKDPGFNANVTTNYPVPVGWAAIVNCAGVGGGSKRWALRGWAEGDFFRAGGTGADTVSAGARTALNELINQLAANNFGLRTLQGSTNVLNPYVTIKKIDGSRNDGTTDITVQPQVNYAAPIRIIIGLTSKKDTPSLNGHFTVVNQVQVAGPPAQTVLTILYRTPGNVLVPNPQGRVRQEVYNPTHVLFPPSSNFARLATRTSRTGYITSRGAKRAARLRGLA